MRQSKLRASATLLLQEGGRHARVDHLTVMEINSVRPLLPHSLHMLRRLQSVSVFSV
jgi:GINS complex subunit 2